MASTTSSWPMERLASSVASNKPRTRARSWRASKCPASTRRRTTPGIMASGSSHGRAPTTTAVGSATAIPPPDSMILTRRPSPSPCRQGTPVVLSTRAMARLFTAK